MSFNLVHKEEVNSASLETKGGNVYVNKRSIL